MKKNLDHSGEFLPRTIFYLTAAFLILFLSGTPVYGENSGLAQDKKVTLRLSNVPLSSALQALSSQAGIDFLYSQELVAGKPNVTVNVNDQPLNSVLREILHPRDLDFTFDERMVVIRARVSAGSSPADNTRRITGTVKDTEGRAIYGASVVVIGTTTGTATDASGSFSLTLPATPGTQLQVSFVGYQTQVVSTDSRTRFDLILTETVSEFDHIIVTGYYNTSQTSYTGSAKSYSGDQLMTAGNSNVLKSLSTLDPAFRMTENLSAGSNPNVLPDFTVRGQTAINFQEEYEVNPNQPLFILDGFEVDAETIFDMDIYRVQNVTILKDASATAIYGSRASNGVVVITTYGPVPGKLTIRYNLDLSFEAADLSDYNLMNASEKLATEIAAGMYSYYNSGTAEEIARANAMLSKRMGYIMEGVDTYWLNKPLHSLAVGHRHRINIEGGDERFRYMVNGMYDRNPGVMKESFRERKSIGMRLIYTYKNLRISNELSYNSTKAQNSPYGSFSEYAKLNPYLRYKDDNGNYIKVLETDNRTGSTLTIYNPLYNSTLNSRDDSRSNYLTNNFNVVWDVTPDLKITGTLAVKDYDSNTDIFKSRHHTSFANYSAANFERMGSYYKSSGHQFSYDGSLVAAYQKTLGKHTLTGRLGYNIQEQKFESHSIQAEGFPNDFQDDIGFALQYAKDTSPSSTNYTTRMIGMLANANYIYDERYMADVSVRLDAQSSFGADRKWAPFWAFGLGWNIHKERFLPENKSLNLLKLRASVGETGSVDYDPAQAITTYSYLTGTRYIFSQGAMMKFLGNDDLGWQKTLTWNVGFDASLFNERFDLTFDYYKKTTNDMITNISVAPSLGYNRYMANLGKVENKGFEIYMRAEVLRIPSRRISVSLFGQLMRNQNKLLKLSNGLRAYNEQQNADLDSGLVRDPDTGVKYNSLRVNYIEGKSINAIWVNQSLGIDPATGREFFLNLADGGYTTTWTSLNNVYGGTTDPKFYGTFGASLSWKGLLVTAHFGYSYGGWYYNQTLVDKVQDADLRYNVDKRVATDRWMKAGDISKFSSLDQAYGAANTNKLTRPTSRFVEKRSYLELSSITASYDIRGPRIESSPIQNIRLNFSMDDLFHKSTVRTERGTAYPYSRSFSLGAQVTF